jgi:hypothetical protein
MVDAQASGLAAEVRALGNLPYYAEGWQTAAIGRISRLYLAATGYPALAGSSDALLPDLRTFIGFTQTAEMLQDLPGIADRWMVIGKRVSEEGPLTTEQYWLAGAATGRSALVLQFIVRGATAAIVLTPGQCFEGEVVYYPSVTPLRAAIRTQNAIAQITAMPGLTGWEDVAVAESAVLAANPFAGQQVYVMAAVRPVRLPAGTWAIEDRSGAWMHLAPQFGDVWKWAALSGGHYLQTAVLGSGHYYEPLGAWDNQTYLSLS